VASGAPPDFDLGLLAGQVRTAANYQAVAQLSSLQHLLDNASIAVRMLSAEYSAAGPEILRLLELEPRVSPSDRSTNLRCDLALCYAKTGRLAEAGALVRELCFGAVEQCLPDDRLLAYHSLWLASIEGGDEEAAGVCEKGLNSALSEHQQEVRDLRALVAPFASAETLTRLQLP
jgi:hypothetical protein